jgi:hypothetical protein
MSTQDSVCVFCKSLSDAEAIDKLTTVYLRKCRTCGDYKYSDCFASSMNDLTAEAAYKISAVLRERTIKGLPAITLVDVKDGEYPNGITVDEIVGYFPNNAIEMIERSLINIAGFVNHPCDKVTFPGVECVPVLFAKDITGALRMKDLLRSLGYVKFEGSTASLEFIITAEGWEKVAELNESNADSKQVFVAMWFDTEMNRYFKDGIKPGIESAGDYQVLRIDLSEHNNKICDQIIAEIRRSRFVVADFTGNRGGVYFEAGFALGLGIPVIWTVQKKFLDEDGVHFDTRQYNHITYETPEELGDKLNNRIRATIV